MEPLNGSAGYDEEPGANFVLIMELLNALQGPEEGFLGRIGGIGFVAKPAEGKVVDWLLPILNEILR